MPLQLELVVGRIIHILKKCSMHVFKKKLFSSLVEGKQENDENASNAYSNHVEKGGDKKFKGLEKNHGKIDLSKRECYHCHKMGYYKN